VLEAWEKKYHVSRNNPFGLLKHVGEDVPGALQFVQPDRLSQSYFGGCWRFFELSNGGFYMSPPDDAYEICIDSNGFHGLMSADAAGIAVCLVSFSQLSFEYATDIFSEHFHQLREFASDHLEAVAIFEAID
jgi:Antirestriction protein/HipA N-terminal domain